MTTATRPTLVLLHSTNQNPTNWQSVVEALDPSRPMIAPWIKGLKPLEEAEASKDAVAAFGTLSLAEAAADIANQMETQGIERADVVGFQLGGMVALRLAAELPDRIGHVVAVSTPVLPPLSVLKQTRRLAGLMPKSAFKDQPKAEVLKAMDVMMSPDMNTDLSLVKAPVLAVTAAEDPAAGQALQLLTGQIPQTVTKTLPGADPDLMTAAPKELAALIEEFTAQ
ncbi:MAG: alpha/beta fold hydrolase [Propionibacteriaceae bacterium]|jgi:pimeloyl-ACP methyl ester carboxylesterase|nr:alpha/beta fold hydrolase [Propionibacteriaceae bacterium]